MLMTLPPNMPLPRGVNYRYQISTQLKGRHAAMALELDSERGRLRQFSLEPAIRSIHEVYERLKTGQTFQEGELEELKSFAYPKDSSLVHAISVNVDDWTKAIVEELRYRFFMKVGAVVRVSIAHALEAEFDEAA